MASTQYVVLLPKKLQVGSGEVDTQSLSVHVDDKSATYGYGLEKLEKAVQAKLQTLAPSASDEEVCDAYRAFSSRVKASEYLRLSYFRSEYDDFVVVGSAFLL